MNPAVAAEADSAACGMKTDDLEDSELCGYTAKVSERRFLERNDFAICDCTPMIGRSGTGD